MRLRIDRVWVVESISLFRLLAALLFASLAFQNVPLVLLAGIYVLAICSDLVDGYLARLFEAETLLGSVLDLVSDKSLTIVSLLYAAARGTSLLPLALVATREIVMIGARIIVIGGKPLFPTSKITGGVLTVLLWGTTLFLVISARSANVIEFANKIYWLSALISSLNLLMRVYVSRHKIRAATITTR